MTSIESAAHRLIESGKSCIPVDMSKDAEGKAKKSALVPWKKLQTRTATHEEWEKWGKRFPNAGIALITGKISNRTVVDIDGPEAIDRVADHIPEQMEILTVLTPRPGRHLHFQYTEGIPTNKDPVHHIDTRNEGGYAVIPPTPGYEYAPGFSIEDGDPPAMPRTLKQYINNLFLSLCISDSQPGQGKTSQNSQTSRILTLDFTQGGRNDSLFSVAYKILKGGESESNAMHLLMELNKICRPPLPEKEVEKIFKSALDRSRRRDRNIQGEVREFVSVSSGEFSCELLYGAVSFVSKEEKAAARQALVTLCKEGVIERVGTRNGWYRPVDKNIEFMDFASADISNFVDLHLPLDLHKKTRIFPKGVIVIAGVSGMGKTLWALNAIADNRGRFPIFYFNSEMGPEALKKKLSHFPISIDEWAKSMKVVDSWDFTNIADKVQPDALNVIDYLEPEGDKSFNIHAVISAIVRRLHKGTALITIQKKPGATMGTGGIYSIKAATLALALDWGKVEIVKNRFREEDPFPMQNKLNFEVRGGWQFVKSSPWYK